MLTTLTKVIQLPSISSIQPFKKSLFDIYTYYVLKHCAVYQGYETMRLYSHSSNTVVKTNYL